MNNKTKIAKFENGFVEISDLDTILHIKIKPGTSRKDVEDSFEMAKYVRQIVSEMNKEEPRELKKND